MIGTLAYLYTLTEKSTGQQAVQSSLPEREDVLTLEDKVTMIRRSCGAESIDPNEDVRKYAICDVGKGVRVGESAFITTSSGGPGAGFHVSIDEIELGDTVSVRYVIDEEYEPSLHCSKCSISKIES